MRKLFLSILNLKLKIFARLILGRYKPTIVGITGSVGKTSTKNALYTILKEAGLRVRMAGGNLNNETGLPLSIIGNYEHVGGPLFWFGALLQAMWVLIDPFGKKKYPRFLILEYGADKPGDIKYLTSIATPDIAIVTAIGETPVHIEFYKDKDAVAYEKAQLVGSLRNDGGAILNADDPDVSAMREKTEAEVKTFGFSENSDLRVSDFKNLSKDNSPVGSSFELRHAGHELSVHLDGVVGKNQAYAIASAALAAIRLGIEPSEIPKLASKYRGVKGRTRLIRGVENTNLIDDTYNASPLSTKESLDILSDLKAERKIAILGDMLELGEHMEREHRAVGRRVSSVADMFIGVGPGMLVAVREAKNEMGDRAIHFENSQDAITHIKETLRPGDLVLIKGSQSIRMEKIVASIMINPQEAKSALVRQYGKWLK